MVNASDQSFCMPKETAIELLGGSPSVAAKAMGISPSAVSQWPQMLPQRLLDRVVAACSRLGIAVPAEFLTKPISGELICSEGQVVLSEAEKLRWHWVRAQVEISQSEFGERFDIGGQSAVANFLAGRSQLSLKAVIGFARGLNVSLSDISPRLAHEAKCISEAYLELQVGLWSKKNHQSACTTNCEGRSHE